MVSLHDVASFHGQEVLLFLRIDTLCHYGWHEVVRESDDELVNDGILFDVQQAGGKVRVDLDRIERIVAQASSLSAALW